MMASLAIRIVEIPVESVQSRVTMMGELTLQLFNIKVDWNIQFYFPSL